MEVFSIEIEAREGYQGQLLTLNILEFLNTTNLYPWIFKGLEIEALLFSVCWLLVSEREKVYC